MTWKTAEPGYFLFVLPHYEVYHINGRYFQHSKPDRVYFG